MFNSTNWQTSTKLFTDDSRSSSPFLLPFTAVVCEVFKQFNLYQGHLSHHKNHNIRVSFLEDTSKVSTTYHALVYMAILGVGLRLARTVWFGHMYARFFYGCLYVFYLQKNINGNASFNSALAWLCASILINWCTDQVKGGRSVSVCGGL